MAVLDEAAIAKVASFMGVPDESVFLCVEAARRGDYAPIRRFEVALSAKESGESVDQFIYDSWRKVIEWQI